MITEKTTIEEVCRSLEKSMPDIEEVRERLFRHYPRERCFDQGGLTGKLGEMHTWMRIERVQRGSQGRISIYHLDYIKNVKGNSYYPSKEGTPNIGVRKRKSRKTIGELDLIMLVDGLPVIVETHLATYKGGRNQSVTHFLREENAERKREMCRILFGTDPELIYVIPKEYAAKRRIQGSNVAQFIERGGGIVSFPFTREEWIIYAASA